MPDGPADARVAGDYDPRADAIGNYDLWMACKRAEHLAGRALTPRQMLEAVDADQAAESDAG